MQNLIYFIPVIILIITLLLILFSSINKINTNKQKDKGSKLLDDIMNESPFRKQQPKARPHNQPIARNKRAEKHKQEEIENKIEVYNPQPIVKDEPQIIGLVEPKGLWSRLIMSQKLEYIMARFNFQKDGKGGYWTKFIKAQSSSQGKNQGRGR